MISQPTYVHIVPFTKDGLDILRCAGVTRISVRNEVDGSWMVERFYVQFRRPAGAVIYRRSLSMKALDKAKIQF